MIAARLLGIREFSLAALVKRYFGLTLAEGFAKGELGTTTSAGAHGGIRD